MAEQDQIGKFLDEIEKNIFVDKSITRVEATHDLSDEVKKLLMERKTWVNLWEYARNSKWWQQLPEEATKQHAGQIILVFDQSIIFSGSDAEEAKEKLRSLGDVMNQCYVRYIPQGPASLTSTLV